MTCQSCAQPTPFSIYTGDSKVMSLKAVYADSGDPLDLTDCTEIDIALPKADGTFLHLTLGDDEVTVVTPKVLGKFTAAIAAVDSATLLPGELQNFVVTFTIGSTIFTVPYVGALSVFENAA
jgi:hypothetical protein